MSKAEGGGKGPIDPPPSRLRVTVFFFEASRVLTHTLFDNSRLMSVLWTVIPSPIEGSHM